MPPASLTILLCYAVSIMAKSKRTSASEPPPMPSVGDKVYPANSQMLYEISHVHIVGDEVNRHVPAPSSSGSASAPIHLPLSSVNLLP